MNASVENSNSAGHSSSVMLIVSSYLPNFGGLQTVISRLATRGFKGQFDLRNTDFRILNLLDHAPGMTVNEIARRTHVDKAWISRSLGQLSKKGLVKRGTDKRDSRMAVISLTKYGQSLLEEIRPLATATESRMLDGIATGSFKRDLDRLMKNAEAMLDGDG